jgi:hypothetical protein
MTEKDKKIIEDAEREDIPIFVLTAKDKLSINALSGYEGACKGYNCDPNHILGIGSRKMQFEHWQIKNPDKVKLPD